VANENAIAGSEPIDAVALRNALETTFSERRQQPLPATLPPPPEAWREPYARLASEVAVEADLETAHALAAEFIDPILAEGTSGTWSPQRRARG
jgi:hypothetical protein